MGSIPMRLGIVLLAIVAGLALAIAPSATADSSSSSGGCVWTSEHGSTVSAGYNVNECRASGGTPSG